MFSAKSSTLDFQHHLRPNAKRRNCQESVPTQRTAVYTNVAQI